MAGVIRVMTGVMTAVMTAVMTVPGCECGGLVLADRWCGGRVSLEERWGTITVDVQPSPFGHFVTEAHRLHWPDHVIECRFLLDVTPLQWLQLNVSRVHTPWENVRALFYHVQSVQFTVDQWQVTTPLTSPRTSPRTTSRTTPHRHCDISNTTRRGTTCYFDGSHGPLVVKLSANINYSGSGPRGRAGEVPRGRLVFLPLIRWSFLDRETVRTLLDTSSTESDLRTAHGFGDAHLIVMCGAILVVSGGLLVSVVVYRLRCGEESAQRQTDSSVVHVMVSLWCGDTVLRYLQRLRSHREVTQDPGGGAEGGETNIAVVNLREQPPDSEQQFHSF